VEGGEHGSAVVTAALVGAPWAYVVAVSMGYLLGSLPVALMVGRRHGVDLLRVGDGNPGAWNALEQLGPRRAAPVFAGDALKGLLAGLAGLALGGVWVAYAAVAGAMAGHAFPAFAGFRGGKSIMTFAGGAFALSPVAAGLALAACVAVSLGARSFAWGARAGIFGFPVAQLALDPVERVAATGGLMTLIGLRFLLAGRRDRETEDTSAPATSAEDAGPRG
jgi:acyl phosphate:glycerol-3-phosphate acyltransferase